MHVLGASERPSVVVVGTWDPLTPGRIDLVRRLKRRARSLDGSAAVVLLNPPPVLLLHGRWEVPTYDDPRQRADILRAAGADAVVMMRMRRGDLDLGARDFLRHLVAVLPVSEIWIRPHQSFGRGQIGNRATMERLARQRDIAVVTPKIRNERTAIAQVRLALANGHIHRARRIVSRPPTWFRPRGGTLRLGWLPGWYTVCRVEGGQARNAPVTYRTRLKKGTHGEAVLEWPGDDVHALTFLNGPCDSAE